MNKTTFTEAQLVEAIEAVGQAEKITKAGLSILSRELIMFCIEHKNAALVNTLLWSGKLTPRNQQMAVLYFEKFMPFSQQDDKERPLFKNFSERKMAGKKADIEAWLADEKNDIWLWASTNVKDTELKDRAVTVTNAIKNALKGGKDGKGKKTEAEVLEAVIAGGLSIDAIIALAHKAAASQKVEPVAE